MVEGKNNKQKNRTKYFLPGGKKQIQAVCAFLFLGVLILSCGVNPSQSWENSNCGVYTLAH